MKDEKTFSESLTDLIAAIGAHFLGALFMWWGWNVIAPLLMFTTFTYWEMLAIRFGACAVIGMFRAPVKKSN